MTTDDPNEMVQVKRGSITAYQTALANLQAKNADLLERLTESEAENERLRGANEWLRELVATESCPTCAALSKEDE
jgi:hypothetical protein